jgi:hypothetical protein
MALQFHAYPRHDGGAELANTINQGVQNLGNTFLEGAKTRTQLQRQAMMDRYLQQEQAMKQREFAHNYQDPLIAPNPVGAGPRMEPQPMLGQPRGSSLIEQWNQRMGGGAPQTPRFAGVEENTDPYAGLSPEMARYVAIPGAKNREAFAGAYGKFGDTELRQADIRLKNNQADFYGRRPGSTGSGRGSYFVDPATREMFDANMNPISEAPAGATPRMISNPANGSEQSKRSALAKGARNSISTIKSILNPNVVNELKGIQMTPGKMYSQLASSEAKKVFRHLQNAIANELYLKSGASMSETEAEKKAIMYMPAANDGLEDVLDRVSMLDGEVSLFESGGVQPGSMAGPGFGGGKIRVSNGRETLEIDPSDEAEAGAEGFRRIP